MNVVDGQQRLATIVLFLNAIRREMAGIEGLEDLVEGIRQTYMATTGRDRQPMYKLTLNRDIHRFWINVVLNDEPGLQQAGIRSEQRLAEAAAYFTDYLQRAKSEQGDGYAQWLQDLHAKLTYQLKFTMYRVTDADAGSIFEVMNARGKPLTDLELVKNYLLFAASKLDADQAFQRFHDGVARHFDAAEILEIIGVVVNMNVWTRLKLAEGAKPGLE